jgi:hypothetical protein
MRQSNTSERNISYDKTRARFRVEMRFANSGSRTARVPTLVEAVALRDTWSIERDQLLKEAMIAKTASVPVFSIEHGEVFVEFD